LKVDRARVQVGRTSRFGLLEMSRQRLRPSLGESSQIVCPRCNGQGTIRGIESLALSILRIIEEEAMKEKTGQIKAQLPVEVATFLLNEKRAVINEVEERQKVNVVLIPNQYLQTPHYEVQRVRTDEVESEAPPSYEQVTRAEEVAETVSVAAEVKVEEPAVKTVSQTTAPPKTERPVATVTKPGIFVRLFRALFGSGETEKKPAKKTATKGRNKPQGKRSQEPRGRGRDRDDSARRRQRGERGNKQEQQDKRKNTQQEAQQKPKETHQSPASANDAEERPDSERSTRRGKRGGRRRGGRRNSGGAQNEAARSNTEANANEEPLVIDIPAAEAKEEQPSRNDGRSHNRRRPRRSEDVVESAARINERPATEASSPAAEEKSSPVETTSQAPVAETKPEPAETKPQTPVAETKPEPTETKPQAPVAEAKPEPIETKPQAPVAETKPEPVENRPHTPTFEAKPTTTQTQSEFKLQQVETTKPAPANRNVEADES
jgi:ribonuclease E